MNVGHVVREAATANGDVAAVVPDNGDIMEIKESKNDSFNAVGCILSEKNDFLYFEAKGSTCKRRDCLAVVAEHVGRQRRRLEVLKQKICETVFLDFSAKSQWI